MNALVIVVLDQMWPYLIAGALGLAALVTAYARGRSGEKARQAGRDLAAAQDRLEMNREATAIERRAAGMTDDQARKEAAPWIRH